MFAAIASSEGDGGGFRRDSAIVSVLAKTSSVPSARESTPPMLIESTPTIIMPTAAEIDASQLTRSYDALPSGWASMSTKRNVTRIAPA